MFFHVKANEADFGIIKAGSAQEARNIAAAMAGYASEAEMSARLEQKSEIVAVELQGVDFGYSEQSSATLNR